MSNRSNRFLSFSISRSLFLKLAWWNWIVFRVQSFVYATNSYIHIVWACKNGFWMLKDSPRKKSRIDFYFALMYWFNRKVWRIAKSHAIRIRFDFQNKYNNKIWNMWILNWTTFDLKRSKSFKSFHFRYLFRFQSFNLCIFSQLFALFEYLFDAV